MPKQTPKLRVSKVSNDKKMGSAEDTTSHFSMSSKRLVKKQEPEMVARISLVKAKPVKTFHASRNSQPALLGLPQSPINFINSPLKVDTKKKKIVSKMANSN